MKRKFFVLFVVFLFFQSCNHLNLVSEDCSPPNPDVDNALKIRIADDLYGDTIGTIVDTVGDTTGATADSADVDFFVDLRNGQIWFNGRLYKVMSEISNADRSKLRDDRIDSINAITLSFVSLDSKDTIDRNFKIVDHVCATTTVRVPLGHTYQVLASLWHIRSWMGYNIYDRGFNALDTLNLVSKTRDTLNLVFSESTIIKYPLILKIQGPWSEGGDYVDYVSRTATTPIRYEGGNLMGYYVMEDLRSKETHQLVLSSDTGIVLISFIPNVMSMLSNNGVVVVSADSVFFGMHETYEDTIRRLPMEPYPSRIRAEALMAYLRAKSRTFY